MYTDINPIPFIVGWVSLITETSPFPYPRRPPTKLVLPGATGITGAVYMYMMMMMMTT
jgi:hypothetical protein